MFCNCIGFNGAENNCGIAHILGMLTMNIYDTQIYFLAATIICSLPTLNRTWDKTDEQVFSNIKTNKNAIKVYQLRSFVD